MPWFGSTRIQLVGEVLVLCLGEEKRLAVRLTVIRHDFLLLLESLTAPVPM